MSKPAIVILPVGELSSASIRNKFDGLLKAIQSAGLEGQVAAPVTTEAEAQSAVGSLSAADLKFILLIPLRGLSAQTIEAAIHASQVPCLVCPIQGGFALPSSALAVGAARESGIPVELLYTEAEDPEFIQRAQTFCRAAAAYTQIKKSRIGVIGGLFPNLVSCRYDPKVIQSRLGVAIETISFEEVRHLREQTPDDSPTLAASIDETSTAFQIDPGDRAPLTSGLKLHLVMKQLALKRRLDGFATECWSGFPKELGLNPCLGLAQDAYTLACEGDVMLCISLLAVRYLTGERAYSGDLYDLDSSGVLTLTHCGAPASLSKDRGRVMVSRSQLASERSFETLTVRPRLETGSVTVFRFYGSECDRMHLAVGELLESTQNPSLEVRIKLHASRREFLDQCFGNHYVVVHGDIRSELNLLCKWLKITVVET